MRSAHFKTSHEPGLDGWTRRSTVTRKQHQHTPQSPNREVGVPSLQPTSTPSRLAATIPQPAGWGSFTPAYKHAVETRRRNPPTGRLGCFHVSLQARRRDSPPQSPNRKVGVLSRQPTSRQPDLAPQSPNRKGWGAFHASLQADSRTSRRNPPTGKVGVLSRQPTSRQPDLAPQSPNRQVGVLSRQPTSTPPRLAPNRQVGDLSRQPTQHSSHPALA
jgi:hypothetical protein